MMPYAPHLREVAASILDLPQLPETATIRDDIPGPGGSYGPPTAFSMSYPVRMYELPLAATARDESAHADEADCGTVCCILGVTCHLAGFALDARSDLAWTARQYLRLAPETMEALSCPWQSAHPRHERPAVQAAWARIRKQEAAAVLQALADWSEREPYHELGEWDIVALWDRLTTDEVRAELPR